MSNIKRTVNVHSEVEKNDKSCILKMNNALSDFVISLKRLSAYGLTPLLSAIQYIFNPGV